MGTIRPKGSGYEAAVCIRGRRQSKSFLQKADAQRWILRQESDAEAVANGRPTGHYVRDALRRYAAEVSPMKRGARWEIVRLGAFERMPFASLRLSELTVEHVSAWRDQRLTQVKAGSFLRDLTLLRSVLQSAVADWHWIRSNPSLGVKRPVSPQARQRLVSNDEIAQMVAALGGTLPTYIQTSAAFRLALESAMRAGEILGLTWENVFEDYCRLPMTKNGFARDVPLSKAARAIIEEMRGNDAVKVFTISSAVLDATFRKLRKRAGLKGFTFHDSRATAITRLSRKVDILTLARISGHRDLKQLQAYYRESASDIAARL